MRKVNYPAIVVAAVLAFVASALYYSVLGPLWLELRGLDPSTAARPQVWEVLGQLARNLVVASALAYLLARLDVAGWRGALRLGIWVWLGFEAMAIVGSVLHEGYPLGLYAVHVGDELMTTLLMAVVLGLWPARRPSVVPRTEVA
jgi:hypothetical protein